MSNIIVEEIKASELNNFTAEELGEFQFIDDIAIHDGIESDDDSLPNIEFDNFLSDNEDPGISSNKTEEVKKPHNVAKREKRKKNTLTEEETLFIDKFLAREISFFECAKRMNEVSMNDDDDDDTTANRLIEHGKKRLNDSENYYQRKTNNLLPTALKGMMGEANLKCARGESEIAEKLCLEIIRQEPAAAEPYLTLSQIYESTDPQKYVELLLIAAHINSTPHHWIHLAELMVEKDNLKQASYCYGMATRIDPTNMEIRLKRIEILKELGNEKKVLHCITCMLNFIPKEDHKFLISQAKFAAKRYYEMNLISKALDVMLCSYRLVPQHFTTEDVNSFIDLLINNRMYRKCLNIFVTRTGLKFKSKKIGSNIYEISNLYIPEDMPVDLRTKMCICMIQLNATNIFNELIDNICKYINIEEGGDCYLDIAEVLMVKKHHILAFILLDLLVQSAAFSLAAVWLRHAECLQAIGYTSKAILSYERVISLSGCPEARRSLASIYKQEGKVDDAIRTLSQDPESEVLNWEILSEKLALLKEANRIDEYLEIGYIMLLRHSIKYRSRQEIQIICNYIRISDRRNELMEHRKSTEEENEDLPDFWSTNALNFCADWKAFCELIQTAFEHERYTQLQKLTFTAMTSCYLQHVKQIDYMAIIASFRNKEPVFGYSKIREFFNSEKTMPRFWNLFNLIAYNTKDNRPHRFLLRVFEGDSAVPPFVYVLVANFYLSNPNCLKVALARFEEINQRISHPMILMILGILYLHFSNHKLVQQRQHFLLKGMSYFEEYQKRREPEAMAEILYNKGRFYCQMGATYIAKDYYEKAMKITNHLIESDPDVLDLKRIIAFNLHIIYKNSGNKVLARNVLLKYIVI